MALKALSRHRATAGALSGAILCGLTSPQAARAVEPTPRIYQCVLADGRKVTSDKPIAECMNAGKSQRELNLDGSEKGIVEAPLTEDEKAERDRIRRQREAERTAQEIEVRRDRDMLKRFPNETAHGKAREKALTASAPTCGSRRPRGRPS